MLLFSFLEIKFQNGTFDLLSHFLVTREKTQKFLQHISYIDTHILHTPLFICLTNLQKLQDHVLFFFGATYGVDSYSCHFGAINK